MYRVDQIVKGLRQPELAAHEVRQVANRWRVKLRQQIPHDVAIKGNYWTGNVGNRAVGEILRERLESINRRVMLFSRHAEDSRAPVRIIGGGGGYHDRFGAHKLRKRLQFASGNQGAILAAGVPAIRSDEARQLIKEKLPEIDLITVRSQLDLEQLSPPDNCSVQVTACPTLLYADPNESPTERTGVNFLPWFSKDQQRYDAHCNNAEHLANYYGYNPDLDLDKARVEYIENTRRICKQIERPVFIPFHRDDERFARKHLDIDILPYSFSVRDTFKRVSAVDKMVTTRFHCLIFAAVCEKPILAIAYAPKVRALANRLGIESYRPHHNIPIKFEEVSKLEDVRQAAMKNFKLLDNHVFSGEKIPSGSVTRKHLTDPTAIPQ